MIHIGKNTKSTIISKGISAGKSQNTYRQLWNVVGLLFCGQNFVTGLQALRIDFILDGSVLL
jgi:hypothetical protein